MKRSAQPVIAALRKYDRFVVTMHSHPDPDAVAAAVSMGIFLRSLGKKARVVNSDPCPKWLDFMPRLDLYEQFDEAEHLSFAPQALIVLDCGDLRRAGAAASLAARGVKVINIDHHVTNARFGDFNHVLDEYSSTSEILFQLFKSMGCRFSKDMAVLLYVGILTDTGSFGFDCTRAHTHEVIAELLRFDFSVSELYQRVYETLPRHDLKRFLRIMGRLELFYDERVACLSLSRRNNESFSDDFDLKDKIFTFLRSVRGLEIIVILTEQNPREAGCVRTRLNFRSRGDIDVARLASLFHGGGHKKASGGYCDGSLAQARATVLKAIGKVL